MKDQVVVGPVRTIDGTPEPIEYTKEFYEQLLSGKTLEGKEGHKLAHRK